jgi:hypothetical protein
MFPGADVWRVYIFCCVDFAGVLLCYQAQIPIYPCVGYWFNYGVLCIVFPRLLLYVYVHCPVVFYCCVIAACYGYKHFSQFYLQIFLLLLFYIFIHASLLLLIIRSYISNL